MTDFFPILGYDHLEFYVGNARQAAGFYEAFLDLKRRPIEG